MQYARLAVVNVLDHLWAVRQLLSVVDELPLFAHSTVARVAAEGAAKVAHLLDAAADYETRLLRIAVLVRDDAAQHVRAAHALPASLPLNPAALTRAQRGEAAVRDRIARAGIVEVSGKTGKPTWLEMPGHARVPLKLQLSRLVEERFPDLTNMYRHTSGVVHSAPWMLADAVTSSPFDRDLRLSPDLLDLGASALISVEAAGLLATTYGAYYGHDPANAAAAARNTRRRAMDLAMTEALMSSGGRV
ncbi:MULTISPECIES: hypothetical protein [unclassified Micromonospora]|uniref:hypothetical protein n=1 Tax=Micromonospora TaxID=1873 RepID=UPI00098D0A2B|nr:MULTISPECIES: hypothetical protein [unclassified Micromonospora]OON27140.1 hypothetical protein BSA16_33590 [Micromonospora sp. Rc5]